MDDARESPSFELIDLLKERGVQVNVHDPYVYPDIALEDVVNGVDCLAIVVDHQDYAALDPTNLSSLMRSSRMFVAANSNSIRPWLDAGYAVVQLGNGTAESQPDL